MKSFLSTYLSLNYLWTTTTGGKYEKFYLYFPIALIVAVFVYRIILFVRGNRPAVYKAFDSYMFWGYVSLALFGLWIYFVRTQGLPIFSTRLVSYLWLLSIVLYSFFLFLYFKKNLPEKLEKYTESARKARYLKKK